MSKAVIAETIERLAQRRQQEDDALLKAAQLLREVGSYENAASEARARTEASQKDEAETKARLEAARQEHARTLTAAAELKKDAEAEAAKIIEAARANANSDAANIIATAKEDARHLMSREAEVNANLAAWEQRITALRTEHDELQGKIAAAKAHAKQLFN